MTLLATERENRYKSSVRLASILIPVASLVACGSAPKDPGKYPPRAEGCEVTVYPDAPTLETDNIGTATATCGDDISDADCLRTLKDQACKLGADVLWGVPDKPTLSLGKKKLSGRAAHTKTATAPASSGK